MKAIKTEIVINSIRSRKDGSLGVSLETPELTVEEKVAFMELQGKLVNALFVPQEHENAPVYKIDKSVGQKTPSQRLYNTIFKLYQLSGSNEEFSSYYERFMENLINKVKEKLI